jgi:hypothetical protein
MEFVNGGVPLERPVTKKKLKQRVKELEQLLSEKVKRKRQSSGASSDEGEDVAELGSKKLPKGVPQDISHAIRFDRPLLYGVKSQLGIWSPSFLHFVRHPESRLRGTGRESLLRRFAVISQHPVLREQWEQLVEAVERLDGAGPLPVMVRAVAAELATLFITCNKLDVVVDAEGRVDLLYNMLVTPLATLLTLSAKDVAGLKASSMVTSVIAANSKGQRPYRYEARQQESPRQQDGGFRSGILHAPQSMQAGQPTSPAGYPATSRVRADQDECFNCGATGHIRRECPLPRCAQPWHSRRMPTPQM